MIVNDFYQLGKTPFAKGAPTGDLFLGASQDEALSRLQYVAANKLFSVLIGDCGVGKSTVLRKFSDSLDDARFELLYLADSKLTPRHFYNGLLSQLGREGAFYRGDARRKLHQEIEVLQGGRHRNLVVVVDEAHLLEKEMLEEIRFLLNFKMDSESPLALILSGQPELEFKIEGKSFTAIKQRIDFHCRLSPLTAAETGEYIAHQLRCAGLQKPLFSELAVKEIFAYSGGAARLINKACSRCMMYGSINKLETIDEFAAKTVIDGELK